MSLPLRDIQRREKEMNLTEFHSKHRHYPLTYLSGTRGKKVQAVLMKPVVTGRGEERNYAVDSSDYAEMEIFIVT